jgi:hypothetical protein
MANGTSHAQRDAEVNRIGAGLNFGVTATVLGYGDPVPTAGGFVMRPGGEPVQETVMAAEPITVDDVSAVLSGLTAADQTMLAIELLAIGAYDNIEYMFDENNQIDQPYFVKKVTEAIGLAATSAEYGLDTEFLDVLLRNTDRTPEELTALFAEKKAEAQASGGRIINYIDPVALIDAAKKGAAAVTGRMATAEESQAFVKMIHGLQASGMTGINVGARVESFFREQAPEEAKAMDYAGAAGLVMQALGMRGR